MLDSSKNLDSAEVVVELGPGTGVFTREILKRIRPTASFICIEANQEFCHQLQPLFDGRQKSHLVCGSAANIKEILNEHGCQHVDTVISALPYSSLPLPLSKDILRETTELMSPESEFFTILYSMSCKSLFSEFFSSQNWQRVYRNIPPAYLIEMSL